MILHHPDFLYFFLDFGYYGPTNRKGSAVKDMSDIKTFPCPNCSQIINSSMDACRFCSHPLDLDEVSRAVADQNAVNEACNAASNVRILAGSMATLYLLSFVPFIWIICWAMHWILFAGVPISLIAWMIRHSRLKTADPSFRDAKRAVLTAFLIWAGFAAFRILIVATMFFGGARL
ncbi:MAG: hypothetical protein IPN69_03880 [Acidobacteria bacterium]|nr:hypothetical protein [Acidobacteriota bacterium]